MSIDTAVLASMARLREANRAKRKRKRKRQRKPSAARFPIAAPRSTTKGAEIRAKIAANRAKRLAIADAMKREAGVTEHTVHKEDFGGLAYIGTGRILSPEGRKIVQLYIVAHECGHIFLQNAGVGYSLPAHVKELEAESYAHQAFREHGMTLPRRLSDWGRRYVGEWVEKDRAAGITIDPRAIAYAAGRRSPYEPLRMVPATWKVFRAAGAPTSWLGRLLDRLRRRLAIPSHLIEEARAVIRLAARGALYGTGACMIGVGLLHSFYPDIIPRPPREYNLTGPELGIAALGGLLIANLVVLVRTMMRVR
jgi:hypothetical protein